VDSVQIEQDAKPKKPLGGNIPSKKQILYPPWRDQREHLWSIDQVVGYFALWAIRQSPYDMPRKLTEACEELTFYLKEEVLDFTVDDLPWFRCIHDRIEKMLLKVFDKSTWVMDWNEPINATHRPDLYARRYDHGLPLDPDNDFIDLHALARNISHSLIAEALLNEDHKGVNKCPTTGS
jgi:hypothetical protein